MTKSCKSLFQVLIMLITNHWFKCSWCYCFYIAAHKYGQKRTLEKLLNMDKTAR